MKVEIFNQDFRVFLAEQADNLPENTVYCTDPPYNIGYRYNAYKDKLPGEEYIKMLSALKGMKGAIIHYPLQTIQYISKALGDPDDVEIWCYASNLPHQSRIISIYGIKADRTAVRQPYRNLDDKRIKARIEAGSEGARLYDWFADIPIVKNVSKEKGIHPCPVPIALMERVIKLTTNVGDTVFDPFMGCGTTAIAAINTGRNFLGCEIDPVYFAECEARLRALGHF